MEVWKMIFLFQRVSVRYHVNFPGVSNYQRIMASIQTKRQDPGSSKTSTETQADPCRDDSSKFNSPSKSLSTTPRACVKKTSRNMPWWVGTFFVHNSWILLIDGSEIRRENQLRERYWKSHCLQGWKYIPGGCWGFLPSTVSPQITTFWIPYPLCMLTI